MKSMKLAAGLALAMALAAAAGCDSTSENVNEAYTGVPATNTCAEFYKLPANVAKCVNESGRH